MGLVLDSVSCLVCTSLPVSDFAIVLSSLLNDSLLRKLVPIGPIVVPVWDYLIGFYI